MLPESSDPNVLLIQQGLVHIHGKIDRNHQEVMSTLAPLAKMQARHHDDLTMLKRDRHWSIGIILLFVADRAHSLVDFFRK